MSEVIKRISGRVRIQTQISLTPKPMLLNISIYCHGEILHDRGDAQILFSFLHDKVKMTVMERLGRSEAGTEA